MNRMNWKKEMPEVPENVHMAVLDALENLNQAENSNRADKTESITRGIRRGRRAVVAAIVAATMLGTTALAAEFIWNNKAVEDWNFPSEDLQQDTIDNQVAILQNASVTDSGITITAVQTLQDKNRVYLLLKVEGEEAIIDGNSFFNTWNVHDGDGDMFKLFCNGTCNFLEREVGELKKEGYYVIDELKHSDWNGDSLQINLGDFNYCTYENYHEVEGIGGVGVTPHRVDGNWDLEVQLADVSGLCKTIPVNTAADRFGIPITVQEVKLSPLSMEITYSYDYDKTRDLSEEEQANFSTPLLQIALYDQEGNIIETGVGAVSDGFSNRESGEWNMIAGLNSVIDVDAVDKIVFADGWLTVPVE